MDAKAKAKASKAKIDVKQRLERFAQAERKFLGVKEPLPKPEPKLEAKLESKRTSAFASAKLESAKTALLPKKAKK
jgi:hypothetical protein